jgi:hypothetical protein
MTSTPKQPDPVVFRPGPSIERELAARAGAPGERPGLVAKRDLGRYYALIREELRRLSPPLTQAEASLICDACNGTWMGDEYSPGPMILWAEVADACRLNELDAKWGVDGDALVARLQRMTPGQLMAIADAVERFWLEPDLDTEEGLRRVGLMPELPGEGRRVG